MAIINFEKIADDVSLAEVPDGYRNLIWKNFIATDDDVLPTGQGFANAVHSGEAAAFKGDEKPSSFKSSDSEDDFDLNSGFFAAFNANDLKVKVFGFDDGEKVAAKIFFLDVEQEFVTFGRKFDDIDEVRFSVGGGTNPDPKAPYPPSQFFAVDDLFIDF
jgi:hypothetical protein